MLRISTFTVILAQNEFRKDSENELKETNVQRHKKEQEEDSDEARIEVEDVR